MPDSCGHSQHLAWRCSPDRTRPAAARAVVLMPSPLGTCSPSGLERHREENFVTTTVPAASVAAQAVDVRKVYGSPQTAVTALDGVSAAFPAGEFSAIMGPSGSGKSTFMH